MNTILQKVDGSEGFYDALKLSKSDIKKFQLINV